MRIPKKFNLAGLTIKVKIEDDLVESKKCIGEARYSKQEIAIDTSAAPKELTEQSFYHELTHWILYMMGEEELRNNEKFVDIFAHFWYQFETTREDSEPRTTQDNPTYKRQDNPKSTRPKK